MSEEKTYCGSVVIVGRPNAGKSTLLNNLLGQKISIIPRRAQTTRHRIVGIHTEGVYQAIYIDTPGPHMEEKRAINRLMNKAASSSIGDVELVIFVVESARWTPDDEMALNKLRDGKAPAILAVNKVDNAQERADLPPHLQFPTSRMNFPDTISTSAETDLNVNTVTGIVCKHLSEAVHHSPEDCTTDRLQRSMTPEIVHEKLMRFLGAGLPYSITVEIERSIFSECGGYDTNGPILVECERQKKMAIGNRRAKIKTIGAEACKNIREMFGVSVHLRLWMKVRSDWADNKRALRSLGYGDDVQTHPLKYGEYMEGWQRAFALHSRPWSEASLASDAFAEESGRVCLVTGGARSKRSSFKGALQPFTPLLPRLDGRGEVKTLRSAEAVSLALPLSGVTLYSGLYISELVSRILEYETCSPALFFDCLNCIQALVGMTGSSESVLRRFELALLGHLGYGVDFTHCVDSDEPVDDTIAYRHREEKGFTVSVVINNVTLTGRHLKALESREFPNANTFCAVKHFTHMALKPYLGGKSLKSRELLRQFIPKRK